jgi:hypothetical protein
MSEQDDFMTPEEIQAKANQAKINRFVSGFAIQCIVFTVICYATFKNNEVAEYLLYGYSVFIALGYLSYMYVATRSIAYLVEKIASFPSMLITSPSAKVMRGIGMLFTIVEIPIMLTHGFIPIAILWGLAELFQVIACYKIGKAAEIAENE